ncbi:MAG: hypothetical protein HOW73_21640 [Polyangiaceae bacterium]|nr:hypothetical protein [Polyangiaceae bacterium]
MSNENEDGRSAKDAAGIQDAAVEDQEPLEARFLRAPPPDSIADLAHACVRFVERAVGVKLDFTPETLPLLDHYLAGARDVFAAGDKTKTGESFDLVAQAAGAYFGEVVRRRYASWWRLGAGSGDEHRLEFHRLHLVIHPVLLVSEALLLDRDKTASDFAGFDLDASDVEAAARRLSELPPVDIEEFVRPTTRLEALDIIVDAVRADHAIDGADPLALEPNDYVH